jgi:hypothetical protein
MRIQALPPTHSKNAPTLSNNQQMQYNDPHPPSLYMYLPMQQKHTAPLTMYLPL